MYAVAVRFASAGSLPVSGALSVPEAGLLHHASDIRASVRFGLAKSIKKLDPPETRHPKAPKVQDRTRI